MAEPGLLRTPGLLTALVMGAAAFGGWAVLLPVVPLVVSETGGSDALAGSVTGIFMAATVATQLAVPRMLRVWGHRWVLALGCLLLGPPSLLFLMSTDAVPVLAVSAVRGSGFGMLTVAGSALVAELVPRHVLGRATGAQGIAISAAQVVGLPAGLAVYQRWSETPVFLMGALIPILAVGAIARLPTIHARPVSDAAGRPPIAAILVPWAALAVVAAAFGGVSSLLPIAIADRASTAGAVLAVVSAATLVGRYTAGAASDRIGPGRMLVPAMVSAILGLALFSVAVANAAAIPVLVLVLGGVAFGFGFGAVQNDSLVMIFTASGPSRFGAASAGWNIGFDAGTGFGALMLGITAAVSGYVWVFALAAAAVGVIAVANAAVGVHARSGSRQTDAR